MFVDAQDIVQLMAFFS